MNPKTKVIAAAGFALLCLLSVAHAQTLIYSDTFDRGTSDSTEVLNGTSPTVGNDVPAWADGATWTASTNFTTDGTKVSTYSATGANYANAFLPATMSANSGIYTLTVTYAFTGGSNWLLAGFSSSATPNVTGVTYQNAIGWASYNNSGNVSGYSSNSTSFGGISGANSSGSTPLTLSITINTDTTVTTDNLTIELLSGSKAMTSIVGTLTAAQIASIKYIELGSYQGAEGTFSNLSFTVTTPIPEPATTAAMIGLGILGSTLFMRRRSRLSSVRQG